MAKRYPNLAQVAAHPAFDAVADPRQAFVLIDDFVGLGPFNIIGTVSVDGRPGVLDLDTATAATFGAGHDANEIAVGGLSVGDGLYVAFATVADAAGDELAMTFGGATVDIDVGELITVDNAAGGDAAVSTGVTVVEDQWYTVEVVFTTGETAVSVDGGNWAVAGPIAAPQTPSELSFVGTNFLDFVVVRQRVSRAGFANV